MAINQGGKRTDAGKKRDDTTSTGKRAGRVTLKAVAEHLGLSPATVSVVLNRSPVADSIPEETKKRVLEAARELDYRPNFMARSLRRKRSFSVGVLVPEISDGYAAGVMSGVEGHLLQEGYFYVMASHRARPELVQDYLRDLEDRSVEGFILVAAQISAAPPLPTVAIAGHRKIDEVTNVVIDHDRAATLALSHLVELGHRRIAFFKGPDDSADADDRWRAIVEAADALGLEVREDLTTQLVGNPSRELHSAEVTYQEGYALGRQLLDRSTAASKTAKASRTAKASQKPEFTALFAFNDISAIGAMRAFLDAGLRIPEDLSVVGFDDIQSAAFHNPSLTTVRQPLRAMGETAGQILLRRLAGEDSYPDFVTVEPDLVIRASTGSAPQNGAGSAVSKSTARRKTR